MHDNHLLVKIVIDNQIYVILFDAENVPEQAEKPIDANISETDEEGDESQLPELFPYQRSKAAKRPSIPTVAGQFVTYIERISKLSLAGLEPLDFWMKSKEDLHLLYPLATRLLAVPTSSAPIERVFSHGGLILRPHRASMCDQMLSNLIFLKCNM